MFDDKSSKKYLESIFNFFRDGIFIVDENGRFIKTSHAFNRVLGYEHEELNGRFFNEVAHEDEKDAKLSTHIIMQYFLKSSEAPVEMEFLKKTEQRIPVRLKSFLITDNTGQVREAIGIIEIIRESQEDRIKRQREIEESKDFLESVFENTTDGLIIMDEWGVVIRTNKAVEKMLGCDQNEIIGRHPSEFIPELMIEKKYDDEVKRMFLRLSDNGCVENFESAFMKKDGEICHVELNINLMKDKSDRVTGTIMTVRDITERVRKEHEFLKTKRLESIIALAEGIANDFNSIFTSILGDITMAQSLLGNEDETFAFMAKAEKEALRAKDLIEQLLMFSKRNKIVKEKTSIVEVLKEVLNKSTESSEIQYEYTFNDHLWPVEIDRRQICQVLGNLLMNAIHAMPEGGVIRISAENIVVESAMNLPIENGRYIKITLQDQGIGILNEYIQEIFDPYFLKGRKRSGFVLATAYSVIKKHNGLITVESEFGSGTTFSIYLPAI